MTNKELRTLQTLVRRDIDDLWEKYRDNQEVLDDFSKLEDKILDFIEEVKKE